MNSLASPNIDEVTMTPRRYTFDLDVKVSCPDCGQAMRFKAVTYRGMRARARRLYRRHLTAGCAPTEQIEKEAS